MVLKEVEGGAISDYDDEKTLEAFAEALIKIPHQNNRADAGPWLWFMLDL